MRAKRLEQIRIIILYLMVLYNIISYDMIYLYNTIIHFPLMCPHLVELWEGVKKAIKTSVHGIQHRDHLERSKKFSVQNIVKS